MSDADRDYALLNEMCAKGVLEGYPCPGDPLAQFTFRYILPRDRAGRQREYDDAHAWHAYKRAFANQIN